MRDDVLTQLVDKAVNDTEFRTNAKNDLEGTLRAHNFDLTAEELTAVKDFQAQTANMSDEEIDQMLSNGARKQHGPI